jgi:hypothetical protein
MNYEDLQKKYLNKKFIIAYVCIFIILYVLISFIRFLGQIPILLIVSFFITYYLENTLRTYFQSS